MKKLSVYLLMLGLVLSMFFLVESCQSKSAKKSVVEYDSSGLIEDAQGDLHLPIDFIQKFPKLTNQTDRKERLGWFDEATLGLFIDFGLHTYIGNFFQGSPVSHSDMMLCLGVVNPADYEAMAKSFKPSAFKAKEFLKVIDQLGAQYVVLNAKSLDGFTMFNSAYTQYDVVDAPEKGRDIYAGFISDLKKRGIKVGFQYSILDWNHPSQAKLNEEGQKEPVAITTTMNAGQKEAYFKYIKWQLRELVKNYGADMILFNGEWVDWWTCEDGWALQDYLLRLNPDLIVDNRIGKRTLFDGDFLSDKPSVSLNGESLFRPWQIIYPLDSVGGYYGEQSVVPLEDFVKTYYDTVGSGGNLLVKMVLPQSGALSEASLKLVDDFNRWMNGNLSFFNGLKASPPRFRPKGFNILVDDWRRFVVKENKLYLLALKNPIGTTVLVPEMEGMRYTRAAFYGDGGSSLYIKNMKEVLAKRKERALKSKSKKKKASEEPVEGEGKFFDNKAEQRYFGIENRTLKSKPYGKVQLKMKEWPKGESGKIIEIDMARE